jgi:uncharacterized membrane protein
MKPLLQHEAGYSMALWAALLAFVLAPLMSLAVDITRLLFVRADLQASVDAACEAAALAGDSAHFRSTGEARIDLGRASFQAAQAFQASAVEAGLVLYQPALAGVGLLSPTEVACAASAAVQPLIPFSPELHLRVGAQAKMRFVEREP